MNKKYVVRLTADERSMLEQLVSKGKTQAYRIKHANVLLAVDADGPGWSDGQTAQTFRCHQNTAGTTGLVSATCASALSNRGLKPPLSARSKCARPVSVSWMEKGKRV